MNKTIIILSICMMTSLIACGTKPKETKMLQNQHDYKIYLLEDVSGERKADILIAPDPDTLKKYIPDNTYTAATNAFLLQMNGNNILFDTGVGVRLVENLASHAVSPEQVYKIFITHCHGDHIGGLLRDGQVLFPNAEIYLNRIEYNYWQKEQNPLFMQVVAAYRDKLHLFDMQTTELLLFPSITAISAYGHTPGHTMFLVDNENPTLIWGDITHVMPIQMPHPEYSVSYDTNPQDAATVRSKFLQFVAQENMTIAGMHVPGGMGKVFENQTEGGYSFQSLK